MKIINGNSLVIYLEVSPQEAFKRLRNMEDRPLIKVRERKQKIEDMLKARKHLYRKYADIIINADGFGSEEVVKKILKKIKYKNLNEVNKC